MSWIPSWSTVTDWGAIRHFRTGEFQKDPDKVHPDLVGLLDVYRETLGRQVGILVAWDPPGTGHVEDSAHPKGLAVDFYVPGFPLVEAWLWAERFRWNGIGLYPWWRKTIAPGVQERIPGLHCDLSPRPEHPELGRRWYRDAGGAYHGLDRAFLRRLADDDFPVAPSNST